MQRRQNLYGKTTPLHVCGTCVLAILNPTIGYISPTSWICADIQDVTYFTMTFGTVKYEKSVLQYM